MATVTEENHPPIVFCGCGRYRNLRANWSVVPSSASGNHLTALAISVRSTASAAPAGNLRRCLPVVRVTALPPQFISRRWPQLAGRTADRQIPGGQSRPSNLVS